MEGHPSDQRRLGDLPNAKEDVSAPRDPRQHERVAEDDDPIGEPIGGRSQSICRTADTERNQLNRPEPAHALPTDREEGAVEEEEGRHDVMGCLCSNFRSDSKCDQTHEHARRAENRETSSAPELVHAEQSQEGCNKELGRTACSKEARDLLFVTKLIPEHSRQVLHE